MCTDVLYHKSVCKYLVCDSQSLRRRLRVTRIALPAATTQLQLRRGLAQCKAATVAAPAAGKAETVFSAKYEAGVSAEVVRNNGKFQVTISLQEAIPTALHWAVNDWQLPPQQSWPSGTQQMDNKAVQTLFTGDRSLHLEFDAEKCPSRLVFVLKQTQPEKWINNGGTDFSVQIKPPSAEDLVAKVVNAEATYTHWSLFNRFCMALEVLDAADSVGPEAMAFVMVWLRLSTARLLPWYKNSSYQSKDIAHVQKSIAQNMADKSRTAGSLESKLFARMSLAGLPRGGGDGDAIRMGILHIMRENGIREGHRPGIECHFLEQWHQKLHTNTTPEDITICEAYLAFLGSGYDGDFWQTLWDRGHITRDMLATMDHPITASPLHLPQLIGPMQHYLWILKTTHSGADMDVALEMAKGSLDGDLQWNLHDLLSHREDWWVPGKLVELRQRLQGYREGPCSRDVVLLDIALEGYLRLRVDRMEKSSMSGDDLISVVTLVLRSHLCTMPHPDFQQCLDLWGRVQEGERWTKPWALRALAAAQRTALTLATFGDRMYSLCQPHAERFGRECQLDPKYIVNFGEEVVRGQPVFALSLLLSALEPMLRSTAGVASWSVVSQAAAVGRVAVVPSLADIQGQNFPAATVVIAGKVGGMEDIPENVQAVLTSSTIDVLSHVAIRARTQQVLLATCYEDWQLEALKGRQGSQIALTVDATGAVAASTVDLAPAGSNGKAAAAQQALQLPEPEATKAWVLPQTGFSKGLVGGKSRVLAGLAGKLPGHVKLPASVALPFGTCERVLQDSSNKQAAGALERLQASLAKASKQGGVPPELHEARAIFAQLQPPQALQEGVLTEASQAFGSQPDWGQLWPAICGVWASKWGDRAWLSRRARGVPDDQLFMACLLQQVVPAEYAFVLHTAHPVTGERGQVFGEVVVGLGETLVGNYAGKALSFCSTSDGSVELLSLPSKRVGLFANPSLANLIARSDSNGEDLETFAGAGLYDSIPMVALEERLLDYASERLFWDDSFQQELLSGMAKLGREVEQSLGGEPQDIEGVWAKGSFTVVQSRPQIIHKQG